MGLQSWDNDNSRKADVTVSKNYLGPSEIKELNRLTTILLDIFEDQLDLGRLVVVQGAQRLLDQQLAQLGRNGLRGGGSIKTVEAKRRITTSSPNRGNCNGIERRITAQPDGSSREGATNDTSTLRCGTTAAPARIASSALRRHARYNPK